MTINTVLQAINQYIRSQTTVDSISPTDLAHVLDLMANFSGTAYPISFFTDGIGAISSTDLIGYDILSITGSGFTMIKGIGFTKAIDAPNVVFIDGNSLPPNTLVLLQTGEGSTSGGSSETVGNLQEVTENGAITTIPVRFGNSIRNIEISAVTADGEFSILAQSQVSDGEEVETKTFQILATLNSLDNDNVVFKIGADQYIILRQKQDEEQAGIVFGKRVQVQDAVNDNEAPSLGQVKGVVANSTIDGGYYQANGDGVTTQFSVLHEVDGLYVPGITPLTPDSAAEHYVLSATAFEFVVQFITAPPAGENNVSFAYTINKVPTP